MLNPLIRWLKLIPPRSGGEVEKLNFLTTWNLKQQFINFMVSVG